MRGPSVNKTVQDVTTLVVERRPRVGYIPTMPNDTEPRTRLDELMTSLNMSSPALADRAGTSRQQIHKLRTGERTVTREWAERLAPWLKTNWLQLMARPGETLSDGAVEGNFEILQESDKGPLRIASNAPLPPYASSAVRDIPVYATGACGFDGHFLLHLASSPIEQAPRTAGLMGLTSVFAIYAPGNSMWPRWSAGDLIYVHRTKPPADGSHVIIILNQDDPDQAPQAMLKRLIRQTADELEVEAYNPPQKAVLPRAMVKQMMRVLEEREYLGL